MSLPKSSIALLSLVFLSQAFSFAVTLLPNLLAGTGLFSPVQASLVLALASLMSGFWQPLLGRWLDEGRFRTAFAIIATAYASSPFSWRLPPQRSSYSAPCRWWWR
jgi:hypothetical protein